MKKSELPLYLKISPIYNKILQLAIAVICIVALMNILVASQNQQDDVISEHFSQSSQMQIEQAVVALKVLIKQNDQKAIDAYIQELAQQALVQAVSYYDVTGKLLASSDKELPMFNLINNEELVSSHYQVFVKEIRQPKLIGYLRFTINKKLATKSLKTANFDVHETMRLLALFAVVIGFLLTRGFSRFSRQGFRIAK